jgi:serine/threonine-protein kinase RsbW
MEPHWGAPRGQGESLRFDLEIFARPVALYEVRRALESLSLPPALLADAKLLTNELVTNSMRHARLGPEEPIRISAKVERGSLRVEVFDGGAGDPVTGGIRPAPGAKSGWGLYLVEALATSWGHGRGRYWFELKLQP